MPQLEKLKVLDLLGVFYEENGRIMVADEYDGTRDVIEDLSPYFGQTFRLLAHHRPTEPVDNTRWGGGCCLYESSGFCPFGHHANPQHLYTFQAVGVLECGGDTIRVVGEETKTPELAYLVGHRSQIVMINRPDMGDIDEKVKSFDPSGLENASVDELIERASALRDFITEIQSLAKDIDA